MTCLLRQLAAATAVLVTAVAVLLLSMSCSSGNEQADPADEVLIPSHELEQVLRDAGSGEREFLEDGRLTFAEYEQAFFNFVACVEAYDDITVDYRLQPWQEYTFLGSSPGAGVGTVVADCRSEFFNEVQRFWAHIAQPTNADVQEGYDWLANCLRAAGVDDVPQHPSGNELIAISERFHGVSDTFGDCAWEMYLKFGYQLFPSAE